MLLIKSIVLIVVCSSTSISGGNIVEELRQRFNYVTDECVDAQNNTHPAYMCSGLLIRGVYPYPGMKFPWSVRDKKKNSFSFTYLRRDHTFKDMHYDAGFILYPHLNTPPNKSQQKILCSFADDGNTDRRKDRGCGRSELDETGSSEPCRTQNITTVSQYIDHCNSTNWSSDLYCGFKMTKETETKDFAVVLEANALLQNRNKANWTEYRVEGWDEGNAKSIPIQAFFHTIGAEKGFENAVKYRDDFYAQSGGETVAIVGIKFPSNEDPNVEITGDEASSLNSERKKVN